MEPAGDSPRPAGTPPSPGLPHSRSLTALGPRSGAGAGGATVFTAPLPVVAGGDVLSASPVAAAVSSDWSADVPGPRAGLRPLTTPRSEDLIAGFFARYAGSSLRTYQSKLAGYARWLDVPLADLPTVLLAEGGPQVHVRVLAYKAHLRDERGLAPSTINGHLAAIHAVVEFLREAGVCDWMLRVRYEKARGYRDTRGPGLKALRSLIAAAAAATDPVQAARDVAMVRLLTDLGLRRGELVELDVRHVERDADGGPSALQVRGKGHADRERLTLPPRTAAAVDGWLAVHPARGAADAPLFTALDPGAGRLGRRGQARELGARLTGLGVAKRLAALARRAGLKQGVRPHGIRHTAITALLDAGLPVREVQRFSRHADVRTIAVYDDNRTDIAGRVAVTMSELI